MDKFYTYFEIRNFDVGHLNENKIFLIEGSMGTGLLEAGEPYPLFPDFEIYTFFNKLSNI